MTRTDDRGLAALAEALIESDLIRRYSEYAIDAHEFTMAREGFDVLAEQWAAAILGDRAVFWPTGTEEYRELIHQYQAEIERLRAALRAGVEIVTALTEWGGNCGGLPQTLQDRADWWRLDVDPALASAPSEP